mmetsp:Transcript_71234/g.166780  ORF Transcript_71234/g.166780 Transcript_71234/m.166780 type:complete len:83 (-) Transcript_71234:131-379(-)
MGSVSNQDSCLLSRGASTADTQMIEDEEEEHRRRQRMLYIQALGLEPPIFRPSHVQYIARPVPSTSTGNQGQPQEGSGPSRS